MKKLINLKEVREAKGMTQQQLASECNVVRQTICSIELGFTKPSIPTAKAIAKTLDFEWTKFFED